MIICQLVDFAVLAGHRENKIKRRDKQILASSPRTEKAIEQT